jgi:hypothetical protein
MGAFQLKAAVASSFLHEFAPRGQLLLLAVYICSPFRSTPLLLDKRWGELNVSEPRVEFKKLASDLWSTYFHLNSVVSNWKDNFGQRCCGQVSLVRVSLIDLFTESKSVYFVTW